MHHLLNQKPFIISPNPGVIDAMPTPGLNEADHEL